MPILPFFPTATNNSSGGGNSGDITLPDNITLWEVAATDIAEPTEEQHLIGYNLYGAVSSDPVSWIAENDKYVQYINIEGLTSSGAWYIVSITDGREAAITAKLYVEHQIQTLNTLAVYAKTIPENDINLLILKIADSEKGNGHVFGDLGEFVPNKISINDIYEEDLNTPLQYAKIQTLTAEIATTGWESNILTIPVSGILESDSPIIDIIQSGNEDSDSLIREAWENIVRIKVLDGAIEVYALEIPEVSIPIQIKIIR